VFAEQPFADATAHVAPRIEILEADRVRPRGAFPIRLRRSFRCPHVCVL
jgi:hypothetical protein